MVFWCGGGRHVQWGIVLLKCLCIFAANPGFCIRVVEVLENQVHVLNCLNSTRMWLVPGELWYSIGGIHSPQIECRVPRLEPDLTPWHVSLQYVPRAAVQLYGRSANTARRSSGGGAARRRRWPWRWPHGNCTSLGVEQRILNVECSGARHRSRHNTPAYIGMCSPFASTGDTTVVKW